MCRTVLEGLEVESRMLKWSTIRGIQLRGTHGLDQCQQIDRREVYVGFKPAVAAPVAISFRHV